MSKAMVMDYTGPSARAILIGASEVPGESAAQDNKGISEEERVSIFLKDIKKNVAMIDRCSMLARELLARGDEAQAANTIYMAEAHAKDTRSKLNEQCHSAMQENKSRYGALLHDTANVVGSVIVFTDMAVMYFRKRNYEELSSALENIHECASVANQVISEKRSLANLEKNQNNSIQKIISIALKLSEPRREKCGEVKVIMDMPSEKICVSKNSAELARVFMNIFNNAFDALSESKTDAEEGKIIHVCMRAKGGKIEVEIADNGKGMSAEVLNKIFNEYYTTKGKSGSGIGLYFCKRIVEDELNGSIWSVSSEGIGTVFHLTIPMEAQKVKWEVMGEEMAA